MTDVKAAICHAFGEPLEIGTIHLRAPLPDEIEVTLKACAICHSDISYIDGGWGGQLPAVYGHEAAGTITKLGTNVRGLALGDTCVITLIRSCGACIPCATGAPTACQSGPEAAGPITLPDRTPVTQAMYCGAFAEKVVVHHSQVVKVPATMDLTAASLLACGVITGIGAVVNAANLKAGQSVVVIGAGGVGLNAIQGARIAGARRIVAVDMSAAKLAMAKDFGATDGILATEPKPWRAAKAALGGGADVVIVSVGAIPAYDQAPRYIGYGGKIIMVGMPHTGETSTFEPANFAAAGQALIGSKMGDVVIARDIPWMIDLYEQGRLKLNELVSKTWPLDMINEAIADTKTGGAKRNVIVF